MAKDITKIVGELVDRLNFKFKAIDVTTETIDTVDHYRLTTTKTYWLRYYEVITIEIAAVEYIFRIVEVIDDESILLKPIDTPTPIPTTGEIFDIPKPTYRHGTARAINEELTRVEDKDKRLFFWLYGVSREKFYEKEIDILERSSPIRVFIFAEADNEDWLTEDHYKNVIRPLSKLFDEFKNIIKEDSLFDELDEFDVIYLPDWGEFNGFKGFENGIMDEKWSGIEGKTVLNIFKEDNC